MYVASSIRNFICLIIGGAVVVREESMRDLVLSHTSVIIFCFTTVSVASSLRAPKSNRIKP